MDLPDRRGAPTSDTCLAALVPVGTGSMPPSRGVLGFERPAAPGAGDCRGRQPARPRGRRSVGFDGGVLRTGSRPDRVGAECGAPRRSWGRQARSARPGEPVAVQRSMAVGPLAVCARRCPRRARCARSPVASHRAGPLDHGLCGSSGGRVRVGLRAAGSGGGDGGLHANRGGLGSVGAGPGRQRRLVVPPPPLR